MKLFSSLLLIISFP